MDMYVFLLTSAFIVVAIDVFFFGTYSWLTIFAGTEIIVALFVYFGIIEDINTILISLAVGFALLLSLTWKPLKKLQNRGDGTDQSSDMIGKNVYSVEEITANNGMIRYSGTDWKAMQEPNSTTTIPKDTLVTIVGVVGTAMIVRPVEPVSNVSELSPKAIEAVGPTMD